MAQWVTSSGRNIALVISRFIKDVVDLFAIHQDFAKAKIPKLWFGGDSKFELST